MVGNLSAPAARRYTCGTDGRRRQGRLYKYRLLNEILKGRHSSQGLVSSSGGSRCLPPGPRVDSEAFTALVPMP